MSKEKGNDELKANRVDREKVLAVIIGKKCKGCALKYPKCVKEILGCPTNELIKGIEGIK